MLAFLRNNPLFLRYWLALWCSEIGDSIRNMVLLFLVLDLSDHSAVAVSISTFCEYAPIFLFGSFVGVFVDRWNRKRTMVYASLFRALMIGFFVAAVLLHSLFMIYTGAFICSVGTLFFRTPSPGFITLLVPNKEERRMASSLRQVSMSSMLLVGPPLGTACYVWIGGTWSLAVNGLLFLLTTLLLSRIPLPSLAKSEPTNEAHIENQKRSAIHGVFQEMKQGFVYSWIQRTIRPLLVSCVFLGFGAGLIQVMYVFVITEFLGLPETSYGLVTALEGLTSLIGAYLLTHVKLSGETLMIAGMLLLGCGLGGTVLFKSFVVLCCFTVLFSVGEIALNMGISILMQTAVAFEYQGRTGTMINTVMVGFMTLSVICSGWLHNAFSVRPVVGSGGICIVIGALICFAMYQPILKTARSTKMEHV